MLASILLCVATSTETTILQHLIEDAQIHGFVSQGVYKTTDNNYLGDSKRGSFELTEGGLNITKQLSDELRAGFQLFTRDFGPLGNYRVRFDFYYLDYRFRDWLGFRAGRIKIPFGLYNETSDIDSARTAVFLPFSNYPPANRDFLLAQTGAEIYGYFSLEEKGGGLGYRLYAGTIFVDEDNQDDDVFDQTLSIPYVMGGRLVWDTPLDGLRFSGSLLKGLIEGRVRLTPEQEAAFKATGLLEQSFMGELKLDVPAILWIVSAELIRGPLLLSTEYSRWTLELESNAPKVFPAQREVSERFHAMGSYQLAPWVSVGAFYALFFPNISNRDGRENFQHDYALTLRFDVNDYWLFKLEAHYLRGTAFLDPEQNGGTPRSELAMRWGLFFAKTTVHF